MTKKLALEKLAQMYKNHDKMAEKEVLHHHNLKAIIDLKYEWIKGDNRAGLFQKGNDWIIYDHTLNRYQDAYINGHFHHSADEIHRLLGIPKRKPNVGYI